MNLKAFLSLIGHFFLCVLEMPSFSISVLFCRAYTSVTNFLKLNIEHMIIPESCSCADERKEMSIIISSWDTFNNMMVMPYLVKDSWFNILINRSASLSLALVMLYILQVEVT